MDIQYRTAGTSTPVYQDEIGPEANISDSLFSMIIFIYVSVTFTYVFYAFCFNTHKNSGAKHEEQSADVESLEENVYVE